MYDLSVVRDTFSLYTCNCQLVVCGSCTHCLHFLGTTGNNVNPSNRLLQRVTCMICINHMFASCICNRYASTYVVIA